jgi:hypothetical protein
MNGTYTLANFHFATDASGGTLVTDPPTAGETADSTGHARFRRRVGSSWPEITHTPVRRQIGPTWPEIAEGPVRRQIGPTWPETTEAPVRRQIGPTFPGITEAPIRRQIGPAWPETTDAAAARQVGLLSQYMAASFSSGTEASSSTGVICPMANNYEHFLAHHG